MTLRFIKVQPGVWVSIAVHASILTALAIAYPALKFPRRVEAVVVTIIPNEEFRRVRTTAKVGQPMLGSVQGTQGTDQRSSSQLHDQPSRRYTVKSARPAESGTGQSLFTRADAVPSRLSPPDQPAAPVSPDRPPSRESYAYSNLPHTNFGMDANIVQPTFKLGISGTAADRTRDSVDGLPELYFLQRSARERNEVHDLKVILSDSEDRVKLTLREADSSYVADLESLRKKGWSGGLETFDPGIQGGASHQRIDVSTYKSDLIEVSGFVARTEVDASFQSFAILDPKSGKKDEFSITDRRAQAAGASLRIGSITLGTSLTQAEKITGIQNPTSITPNYSIMLDFTDLRKRVGNLAPDVLWTILPSSLYGGYSETKNVYKIQEQGPPDYTGVYAAGASWIWSNGYANVNYYYYQLDSGRSGDASYDSSGNGFSGNVGIWANKWTIDGGLTLGRTDEPAPLLKSYSKSRDGYLSATYKSDDLPDFLMMASIGDYGYDQLASYAVNVRGTYSAFTLGLNFAKFIWPTAGHKIEVKQAGSGLNSKTKFALKGPASEPYRLQTFYRLKQETTDSSGSKPPEHLVGVVFRAVLN